MKHVCEYLTLIQTIQGGRTWRTQFFARVHLGNRIIIVQLFVRLLSWWKMHVFFGFIERGVSLFHWFRVLKELRKALVQTVRWKSTRKYFSQLPWVRVLFLLGSPFTSCCTAGTDRSDRFPPMLRADTITRFPFPLQLPSVLPGQHLPTCCFSVKPAASPPRPTRSDNRPRRKGGGREKMGAASSPLSSNSSLKC